MSYAIYVIGVKFDFSARAEGIEMSSTHKTLISLTNGKVLSGDLVIGADGERSIVRSLVRLVHEEVPDYALDIHAVAT